MKIKLGLIGLCFFIFGCFDVEMETKVKEDGSIKRTIIITTEQEDLLGSAYGGGTMGTDLDKLFFGDKKEWKKTKWKEDSKHILKGEGSFFNANAISKENNIVNFKKSGFLRKVYSYEETWRVKESVSKDTLGVEHEKNEKKEKEPSASKEFEPKFTMRVILPGNLRKEGTNADSIYGNTAVWHFIGTDKDFHLKAVSETMNTETLLLFLFVCILGLILIVVVSVFLIKRKAQVEKHVS